MAAWFGGAMQFSDIAKQSLAPTLNSDCRKYRALCCWGCGSCFWAREGMWDCWFWPLRKLVINVWAGEVANCILKVEDFLFTLQSGVARVMSRETWVHNFLALGLYLKSSVLHFIHSQNICTHNDVFYFHLIHWWFFSKHLNIKT